MATPETLRENDYSLLEWLNLPAEKFWFENSLDKWDEEKKFCFWEKFTAEELDKEYESYGTNVILENFTFPELKEDLKSIINNDDFSKIINAVLWDEISKTFIEKIKSVDLENITTSQAVEVSKLFALVELAGDCKFGIALTNAKYEDYDIEVLKSNYEIVKSKITTELDSFDITKEEDSDSSKETLDRLRSWYENNRDSFKKEEESLDPTKKVFTDEELNKRLDSLYENNKYSENEDWEKFIESEINNMANVLNNVEPNSYDVDFVSSEKLAKIAKILDDVKSYPNNIPAEKVTEESKNEVMKYGYKLVILLKMWQELSYGETSSKLSEEEKGFVGKNLEVVKGEIDKMVNSYGQ